MDGTIDYPYDSLFDAIERAMELAAPYYSASITIKLFAGTHYTVRAIRYRYRP